MVDGKNGILQVLLILQHFDMQPKTLGNFGGDMPIVGFCSGMVRETASNFFCLFLRIFFILEHTCSQPLSDKFL